MTQRSSQQDYWNSRAPVWSAYDVPLIPSQPEIDFQQKQLVPGGDVLILGATRELCAMALEVSGSVTAVDFAQDVIEALRMLRVKYVCMDWFKFFEQHADTYDAILTDGGLVCLDYPQSWQRMAEQIIAHLRPGGIFSARVYVSTSEPPKDTYDNPNLGRFVSSMALATAETNWMLHPKHGDYANYDMLYAFPPEREVLRTFNQLNLRGTLVPSYEEGQRFVTFAWQRP